MTEMLIAASLLVLVLGGWVMWLGMARPSWSEFWDRPVCWLVGHNLTNPLFETTYSVGEATYPATLWRCSRHAMLVTVVGSKANQGPDRWNLGRVALVVVIGRADRT